MAITVTLGNASKTTELSPTNITQVGIPGYIDLKFSRQFYQLLGSITKNRVLLDDFDRDLLPLEFVRFLDDMNALWLHTYYPLLAQEKNIKYPSEEIIAIDEYLGRLGVDEDYFYSKDIVNIDSWIDPAHLDNERILIDITDNTYLTDSNGTEILVVDNRRT